VAYRKTMNVPRLSLAAAVIVALAIAIGMAAWLKSGDSDTATLTRVESITHEFPGNHLHGIGFDSDSERLFLATHYGLFVLKFSGDGWDLYQLGQSRDDFMGFAQDPRDPDVIYTSGHPANGGNLGVLRSTDGGYSFKQVFDGPEGEPIDFHSMTISPADPSILVGHYWGDGMLYRTTDGGESWEWFPGEGLPARGLCWAAPCLAADPVDPDTVWAGTEEGLMVSRDGGQSWERTPLSEPVAGIGISNGTDPLVLAMVVNQGLMASGDAGNTWEPRDRGLNLDERELVFGVAFDPQDSQRVFLATMGQRVFESQDGGLGWQPILE
jgi:photosystem II stability/assembly factor-like uncharacterized protein